MDNMMEGYYVWGLKGDLIIEWYSVEQKITSLGIPEHGDHFTKVKCPHILPDSHSIEIYNLEEVRGVLKFLGFPINVYSSNLAHDSKVWLSELIEHNFIIDECVIMGKD